LIQHPNVVRLIDAGLTSGICATPYLATEFVDGMQIDEFVSSKKLDSRGIVALIVQLCSGVAHIHSHHLIHRDIKPANVLVTHDGQVKVVDLGLTRELLDARERTYSTLTGMLMGTPAYMSPEQARGTHRDLGPATDVYGIGAVAYQLLCGTPPIVLDDLTPAKAAEKIAVASPKPMKNVDATLQAIVLRCLERRADRRYPTVDALQSDLDAWLDDRPTEVRPVTRLDVARRFVVDYRRLVSVVSASFVVLISALLLVSTLWRDARSAKAAAQSAERKTAELEKRRRLELSDSYVDRGWDAYDNGRLGDSLVWFANALSIYPDDPVRNELGRMRYACVLSQAPKRIAQRQAKPYEYLPSTSDRWIRITPGSRACTIEGIERDDGKPMFPPIRRDMAAFTGAVAPDGRSFAVIFEQSIYAGRVECFDAATGSPLWRRDLETAVKTVAYSPDGRWIAIGTWGWKKLADSVPGHFIVYDAATGEEYADIPLWANARATAVCFAPDSASLFVAGHTREMQEYSLDGARPLGRRLVTPAATQFIDVVGDHIVTGGIDGKVRLWNRTSLEPASAWLDVGTPVSSVKLSKDGRRAEVIDVNGTVTTFGLPADRDELVCDLPGASPLDVAAAGAGQRLVVRAGTPSDGVVHSDLPTRLLDLSTGQSVALDEPTRLTIQLDPEFRRLAFLTPNGVARFDDATGRRINRSQGPSTRPAASAILVTAGADEGIVWSDEHEPLVFQALDQSTTTVKDAAPGLTRNLCIVNAGKSRILLRTTKTSPPVMECFDWPSLTLRWRIDLPGIVSTTPAVSDDGVIFASTMDGVHLFVDANTGKPISDPWPLGAHSVQMRWSQSIGAFVSITQTGELQVRRPGERECAIAPTQIGQSVGSFIIMDELGIALVSADRARAVDLRSGRRILDGIDAGGAIVAVDTQRREIAFVRPGRGGGVSVRRYRLPTDGRPVDDMLLEAERASGTQLDERGMLRSVVRAK
jgi:outer membrane protein assembly factor BamB